MNTVNVNGNRIQVPNGCSVSVINGEVYINGSRQELDFKVGILIIEGNCGDIRCDGSVTARDVKGSVNCGGSLNCDDIEGNASAGGSINCDDIGGSAIAGGSIRRGR